MPEINLIVSSDPETGATRKSTDGSAFSLDFEGQGLQIPRDARNITVSMTSASVWNSIPNITALNSDLQITCPDNTSTDLSVNLITFTVSIPQGLYDLATINSTIASQCANAAARVDEGACLELQPNYSTNKVEILYTYNDIIIDFSVANSVAPLLGFAATTYTATKGQTITAPNIANLNTINYLLIHTDLVGSGIRIGKYFNQTIGQIQFNVSPGSLQNYEPFRPPVSPESIPGTNIKSARFWITSETNNPVVMTEFWSCGIRISWL